MYRTSSRTVLNKVHILQVCVKGRDMHNRLKLKHEIGFDASSVGLVVKPTHLYRTKPGWHQQCSRLRLFMPACNQVL